MRNKYFLTAITALALFFAVNTADSRFMPFPKAESLEMPADTLLVRREVIDLVHPTTGAQANLEPALHGLLKEYKYKVAARHDVGSGVVIKTRPKTMNRRIHIENKVKVVYYFTVEDNRRIVLQAYAVEQENTPAGHWLKPSKSTRSHLQVHLTNMVKELRRAVRRSFVMK